jgi:hypothetical protein
MAIEGTPTQAVISCRNRTHGDGGTPTALSRVAYASSSSQLLVLGGGHRGRQQPPAQATARNGEANRDPIRVTSAGRGTSSRRPNRQARQRERNDVLRAANQRTNPKQVTVHDTKASYSPDVDECGLIRWETGRRGGSR